MISFNQAALIDVIAATSVCYRKLDSFPIRNSNLLQEPLGGRPRTHKGGETC
jgi:hypothetical protein